MEGKQTNNLESFKCWCFVVEQSVILVLGKMMMEDQRFEVILGYISNLMPIWAT